MSESQLNQPDLSTLESQVQVAQDMKTTQSSQNIHLATLDNHAKIIIDGKPEPETAAKAAQSDAGTCITRFWNSFLTWKSSESASRSKRMIFHLFMVIILLGWWMSGIALKKTRHKWVVTTFWTWLILIIILFRWIPTKYVSRPIGNFYLKFICKPIMNSTNSKVRLSIGSLFLVSMWLVCALGIKLTPGDSYLNRIRSLIGLIIFQVAFWLSSRNKSLIRWRTIIVGLILQHLLALAVLKTQAGYDFFNWIAKAATDIMFQGTKAGAFFFSPEVLENHWFFVNTLAAMIFFIALIQLLHHLGVMQAIMFKCSWVFYSLMCVSGVEAVVAVASPFVGQGENVMLVLPYAAHMTAAEIHQVMTSGFATISGSCLAAYVGMGIPAVYLVSASIMSIPASLAISKLRLPEDGKPLTAGDILIPEDHQSDQEDGNALMKFSDGAWLGLKVAGMILANILTILALRSTVNGLLTWIGQFWGMDPNGPTPLTLELILQYIFYPIAWLMGTPNQDVLKVSRLLAIKLISNEFVAYEELSKLKEGMTEKGWVIAIYSLCGFANLGSLGFQIGFLNGLIPSKKDVITKVAVSALLCGFISTIQTAAISGMIY